MMPLQLLMESARQAIRRPIGTVALMLTLATSTASILLLVGTAKATADKFAAEVEQPQFRTVTLRSKSPGAIDPATASRISALGGVSDELAVVSLTTASNAAFAGDGPSLGLYETLQRGLLTSSGRLIGAGEVAMTPTASAQLGLVNGVGTLVDERGRQWAAVGLLNPDSDVASLGGATVVGVTSERSPPALEYVSAVVDVDHDLRTTALWMTKLATDPTQVETDFNGQLDVVAGSAKSALSGSRRSSARAMLAAAAGVVAFLSFALAAAQRRDVARRRALGAARSTIVGLLTLSASLSAASGVLLGTSVALIVLHQRASSPDATFVCATGVLCMFVAAVASVPGAMLGAVTEPARILRVP
jgi:hypothetical protein